MRFHFRGLCALALGLSATACKFQSNSELKATPEQKSKLIACIEATVLKAFPESSSALDEVKQFAKELSEKAPSIDGQEKDPAFEEYVTAMGCDPTRAPEGKNYGLAIIEQWVLSPHNKSDIGPKDASATVLKRNSLNLKAK